MIWYNDDDPESQNANWKNSELMKSFADQYFDWQSNVEESKTEPINELDEELDRMWRSSPLTGVVAGTHVRKTADSDVTTNDVVKAMIEHKATAHLDFFIDSLVDLAAESYKYGNEKATYMIERTMEEVRALNIGEQNAF